jgi:hypothetical protein
MNKLLKIAAVVTTFLFTTNTYATIYPIVNSSEAKKLVVNLNDWAASDINVIIRDLRGEIIYNDDFAKGAITKRSYDLAYLPNGTYALEIAGSNKKSITQVVVADKNLTVNTASTKIVYKPAITVDGNRIALNHLSLGEDITIKLSDSKGTFFTKTFEGKDTINASFDISDLPNGAYIFSLSSDNQYESVEFKK